ncbi:hypothetical protein CYMTET_41873 [Cymbomonas tetramitiformis]|uniref:Uncharacterized protein n=1 Tax=Cymbomonas tetramitiformis TaxID=36881 RepID=A0AAE0C571_9CHLO|nr:hypothetical protein CYMTET_41872 [Cymbomonas tetramitiformis]KAK3248668.1 hypothetical protein CYMTET_41873 [Cymbomonas tetramitiformis]|eukprot:gene20158-24129_t
MDATITESSGVLGWVLAVLIPWGVLTFIFGAAQLALLNRGLAQFPAVSYLATYKALLTIYGTVAGGVCFSEFSDFDIMQRFAFPGSIGFVIFGLFLLPQGEENYNKPRGKSTLGCESELECFEAAPFLAKGQQ